MQVEPKRRLSVTGAASPSEFTEILLRVSQGDNRALDRLFTLVYNDLRDLAKSYLAREARSHTLQPTALVNEAYLKLVDQRQVDWKNRSHLFAVGAMAMRRILVNHAVAAKRQKRGGAAAMITLHEDLIGTGRDVDVLAIDEALHDLAKLNARHAKLVELRFFGGLSVPEVAGVLGVSVSTVEKDWRFCSAWLKSALRP
ncbi:MAG: sigma-70 family RNA polymerase sigma factor [Acidobacteriaceae bacterium]|nr:sigma-70 family RNA polymerase sigma factor [Acidobacteriaceae bacterium]MBV9224588.1 sigma-70 family RNA polymerase sigma factor [Acidobacteriaceae bacterium]MBV9674936.1 sigma-70 family RNA polymerase sigma factor [Acidobacteriaceae bacterium]MBV9938140.1 sigma-70 family RNA polymerase sigma factor [Acidobacteriaceae bacterium]